jgi:hypoxanthine phosphoribosyltransferase
MQGDLERVLFDEPAIHRRLDEIAAQISKDYRDRELTVIAVLNGSLIFIAELAAAGSAAVEIGLP